MSKSEFDNLSEETRAKLVAAKTPEELLAVAKSEVSSFPKKISRRYPAEESGPLRPAISANSSRS